MVMVIVSIGAPLSLDCSVVSIGPVLRQNSVRRQVIDLSAPVARRSRLNGHSPAPPASTSPDALRRPPSGRPGEPCFAPPTRRLQEDGEPAEVAQQRSTVLGRVVQVLDDTMTRACLQPAPSCGGSAAASASIGGPPARKPPDQGSRRTNGSGQSSLGRAANPWRTADAGNRRRCAHRLPPALAAPLTAVADVAHVPDQSRPGPRRHRPTRT